MNNIYSKKMSSITLLLFVIVAVPVIAATMATFAASLATFAALIGRGLVTEFYFWCFFDYFFVMC
jgi:hypothetical protein